MAGPAAEQRRPLTWGEALTVLLGWRGEVVMAHVLAKDAGPPSAALITGRLGAGADSALDPTLRSTGHTDQILFRFEHMGEGTGFRLEKTRFEGAWLIEEAPDSEGRMPEAELEVDLGELRLLISGPNPRASK